MNPTVKNSVRGTMLLQMRNASASTRRYSPTWECQESCNCQSGVRFKTWRCPTLGSHKNWRTMLEPAGGAPLALRQLRVDAIALLAKGRVALPHFFFVGTSFETSTH